VLQISSLILMFSTVILGNLVGIDTHDQMVHFAAHFGMSYAIHTFLYAVFYRAFSLRRGIAISLAILITLAVGGGYKYIEMAQNSEIPANVSESMIQNTLGTTTSVGTIIMLGL